MRTPSTKTLIGIAILSWLGCAVLAPNWYPPPVPVTAADGSVMHGADGKILVYRDMAEFNRALIPFEILIAFFLASVTWLFVRLCRFVFERRKHKNSAG